jgi:hypothetical protein
LALVTLLTSARTNVGLVGLSLERELFARVASVGIFGTYHFCLDGQRTPDLLKLAASSLKSRAVEVEAVTSLLALARPAPDASESIRLLRSSDLPVVAELIESAGRAVPIHRRVSAADVEWLRREPPAKRCFALLRDDAPIGVCVYARRRLLGKDVAEVANIDLLVAPDITPEEAARFGRALASDAAANGAAYLVAPQRRASFFPHARGAGLRLAPRTLRVFIVPSSRENIVEPGSAHLLEVE